MSVRLLKAGIFALTLILPLAASALEIYGHRGAGALSPENTLPAYRTAMSLGVDVLDMDVHLSQDGVVMVTHDPKLNVDITRDSAGHWLKAPTAAVKDLTQKQLQQYDVGRIKPGSFEAERYPDVYPVDGTSMPTLAEVIKYAESQSAGNLRYQIELKTMPLNLAVLPALEPMMDAVLKVIDELEVIDRVEFQSFDFRILLAAKKKRPELKLSFVTQETLDFDNVRAADYGNVSWTEGHRLADFDNSVPKMIASLGGSVWNPHFADINKARVDEAHKYGIKVIPWTVDNEDHMHRVINLGVDGIITNRPDKLRGVMASRHLTLPAAIAIK